MVKTDRDSDFDGDPATAAAAAADDDDDVVSMVVLVVNLILFNFMASSFRLSKTASV
jgi:hypothetical protein